MRRRPRPLARLRRGRRGPLQVPTVAGETGRIDAAWKKRQKRPSAVRRFNGIELFCSPYRML
jgi:hypothetical protein